MNPSTLLLFIYFGASILLLLILSVHAYRISGWKDTSSFLKAVASMKSIYGTILVHLYDTSTDIAILVTWGILAHNEVSGNVNYENINLLSFLIPSILLIFIYRITYSVVHWQIFRTSVSRSKRDILLILLDLYIFTLVYHQFRLQYISPCMMQNKLQLLESVFESMPQLVMQSIFLIRTYNTEIAQSDSIYIVFASIIASLLSIVTKFLTDDLEWVIESASSSHLTYKKIQFISISYLLVILWRFCESIARFSIFTLLWSVVGGVYLPLYLLINIVIYFCLEKYTNLVWIMVTRDTKKVKTKMMFIWVLQSIVGIPLRRQMTMNIIRFIDNSLILVIIYLFAFAKFDCILCYDKSERNALYNPYILVLLLMSAIATTLALIIYLGLYWMRIVKGTKTEISVDIVGLDLLSEGNKKYAAIHPMCYQWALDKRKQSESDSDEKQEDDDLYEGNIDDHGIERITNDNSS